jgi:phosphatidylserine decarboxylase
MYKILYFLPKNHLSHLMGFLLHIVFPMPIRRFMIARFAKAYKINMAEAERPIDSYRSIGDLFVRRLKPGVRPIQGALVHPVDAVISQIGPIQQQKLIQAKGKTYTTEELLKSKSAADDFEGGLFITYYLCPTDYHRIHSPVSGEIYASTLIPGKLWPVNTWSVNTIDNLFSVNERLVTYLTTNEGGKVAVVKVGATNVGKITLAYDTNLVSNTGGQVQPKNYEPHIRITAGDELGAFHMGSTVVLLLDKVLAAKITKTKTGPVKLGEKLD